MVVYAKSDPLESPQDLWKHTGDVVDKIKDLAKTYDNIDFLGEDAKYFWSSLEIACKAHDLGKLNSRFQYRIINAINKQRKKQNIDKPEIDISQIQLQKQKIAEIPHNILSPAFLFGQLDNFPQPIRNCIIRAVAYHHNRGHDFINITNWPVVKNVIDTDLKPLSNIHELEKLFPNKLIIGDNYLDALNAIPKGYEMYYIMLIGLLYRADHSASAGLPVEIPKPSNYSNIQLEQYLTLIKKIQLKNIWQKELAAKYANSDVILEAGTGMGKTEFALYWINNAKSFYILPIKTSANAMHKRIAETFALEPINIGLLHSGAGQYFMKNDPSDEAIMGIFENINQMRQLSLPFTISTADQIFSSVFEYPGYEKIYASMAGTKIIIDEIQAYDPEIIAAILYGIIQFKKFGAKICIITATLPEMCSRYLENKINGIGKTEPYYNNTPRHCLRIIDDTIHGDHTINIIKQCAVKFKKILIIVNTVNTAIKLKRILEENDMYVNLLHARFTYEDRQVKEGDLLETEQGIWITTQVVEASVDIDFDILITEVSPLDSQIQRWGRIWRNRDSPYTQEEPNIYIVKQTFDDSFYDVEIVKKTLVELEQKQNQNLSDSDAHHLFNNIFSIKQLESSRYQQKFNKSIELFDNYGVTAETKRQAQRLFRDIPNISAIPRSVYDAHKNIIQGYISNLHTDNKLKRKMAIYELNKKTVSFRYRYSYQKKIHIIEDSYHIQVIDLPYTFELGLQT